MKKTLIITVLVAVTSVFGAFLNARVINHQAQSSTEVVQFWVGDEIFFR